MNNDSNPSQAEPTTEEVEPIAPASSPSTLAPQPDAAQPDAPQTPPVIEFAWDASEYVHHHKNAGWYIGVVGAVIVLSGVAVLLKSWLSIALFVVMGAAVIVYAKRPPRVLTYSLTTSSLIIDDKPYPFSSFRSFALMPDVEWHSIDLEPTQRFMPRLSVLFNDEDLDSIVGHLSQHLPQVDREPDMIEKITRYLRF